MKKVLILFSCVAFPAFALVAPEIYKADPACPKNAPFTGPGGQCISCDTTRGLMLEDSKDCDLCPNRTVDTHDSWILSSNYCRLKECPPDRPFYEENWNWSGCKSCKDQPTHIKKEQCEQCPNMRWVEDASYCAPDVPGRFYHKNGNVQIWQDGNIVYSIPETGGGAPWFASCGILSPSYGMAVSEQECTHCQNTYMKDGFCFGKECPADKPIRDKERGCVGCADEPRWITQEECERCPNMRWVDTTCAPNIDGVIYHADLGFAMENGKLKQHRGRSTRCTELTKNYGVFASEKECARCQNTYMKDGFCFGKDKGDSQ